KSGPIALPRPGPVRVTSATWPSRVTCREAYSVSPYGTYPAMWSSVPLGRGVRSLPGRGGAPTPSGCPSGPVDCDNATVTAPEKTSGLSRRGMSLVLVATVFAAASGYVIMLLAGRRLGAAGYAEFTVFWALFFTLVGITNGTMQESTRAVSVARAARTAGPGGRAGAAPTGMRPIRAAVGIGAGLAVVSAATAPLWGQWVLPGNELVAAGLLGLAVWSVTVQATLWGLASGTARWPLYAAGIVVDAALRLVVVAVARALGHGLIGFVVATVAGAAGWLLLLTSPGGRAAAAERVDEDTRAYLGRAGHAMLASAATS